MRKIHYANTAFYGRRWPHQLQAVCAGSTRHHRQLTDKVTLVDCLVCIRFLAARGAHYYGKPFWGRRP